MNFLGKHHPAAISSIAGVEQVVDSRRVQYRWKNFRSGLGPGQEWMIAKWIVDHAWRKLTPHVGTHVIDVRRCGLNTDNRLDKAGKRILVNEIAFDLVASPAQPLQASAGDGVALDTLMRVAVDQL